MALTFQSQMDTMILDFKKGVLLGFPCVLASKTMNCLICNQATKPLNDTQFDHLYHRCEACGFIYMDPAHHVSFEEERAEYNTHENSIDDPGYIAYLERFLEPAVDPFVQEGRALDFGCGPGPVLAELLIRRGFDTSVYDLHFYPDQKVLDDRYHLITSTEVFEHFVDPMGEIEKIVGLLEPGGVLAIMTSFPPHDQAFLNWRYRREATHIAFYTLDSFRVMAEAFGLDVLFTNNKNIVTFRRVSKY